MAKEAEAVKATQLLNVFTDYSLVHHFVKLISVVVLSSLFS